MCSKGLAAYFYSRDLGRAFRLSEALEFGMVGVNEGIISTEVRILWVRWKGCVFKERIKLGFGGGCVYVFPITPSGCHIHHNRHYQYSSTFFLL